MHVKSTYAFVMFLNKVPSFEVSSFKYLINYEIKIPPLLHFHVMNVQNMIQVLGFMCFHCVFCMFLLCSTYYACQVHLCICHVFE
jgi:hypothetical protein